MSTGRGRRDERRADPSTHLPVTDSRRFPLDPWVLREVGFDLRDLAQSESLFALSNGHIGVRGNLDEGDPNVLTGTYLNSFHEQRRLPYAESGFGYPEVGETVVNVTNGKLIRLLVDDEPFDVRYGELIEHTRSLDLRRGVLERHVTWVSPSGRKVRLHTSRLVSLSRRTVMAIRYRVEAVDEPLRVVVQSELVADEPTSGPSDDPREAAALDHALQSVAHDADERRAHLVHRTALSELAVAAAMGHDVEAPSKPVTEMTHHDHWARFTVATELAPGERLELTKYVTYGWSGSRSTRTLRDQVDAGLISAQHVGWDRLEREQAEHLAYYWAGADVEVEGSAEIQRAVRLGVFHAYQASARAERRCIPAKGLTGPGYDGHAFWDTEMFVLPLLIATAPQTAADALRWRRDTLAAARQHAADLQLRGAAFAWRTISGMECSGYWPAGTAAFHVNAAVAAAVARYVWWTADTAFIQDVALPLIVETARLWDSLGYEDADGWFHIDGVTGPDEYSAVVDDNAYTNLMARQNFETAVMIVDRLPDEAAAEHGVTEDEVERWRRRASRTSVPYNDEKQVHEQDRGFTDRAEWDFAASARDDAYPLLLHAPYFKLYRTQVIKQADLALALHWCGDQFTPEQKARNFAYYDRLTVRDSSLSACTQAVVAAECGHLELAANYLAEAALTDVHDLHHNAKDGLHLASLAGSWLALVAGFGGMRDMGEHLAFRPQLPSGWTRLRFAVRVRGQSLAVEIGPTEVRYSTESPETLTVEHRSGDQKPETIQIKQGADVVRPWAPVTPLGPEPVQPAGRAPLSLAQFDHA